MGDGCLMEGISHEACSLAGTLGLGKLIGFYDDNGISIDSTEGSLQMWFTDDTPKRFESYGWHVIANVDGHDEQAVETAIQAAQAVTDKPTLICCKTVIAKGAPTKAGTADAHGAALGEKEVAATRNALGWTHAPFIIPDDVYAGFDARPLGARLSEEWTARFTAYRAAHPALASEFERRIAGALPADFDAVVASFVAAQDAKHENVATRKASQQAIAAYAARLPEMIGGSADLTGSVFTNWSGSVTVTRKEPPVGTSQGRLAPPSGAANAVSVGAVTGNYVYFGVREFAMQAIATGLALHG